MNLRADRPIAAWLAADDVEGARRQIRTSVGQWAKTRFLVQHWQAMLWEAEIDLYAGDGARAWERLGRDARALRRSHMLSVQLIRAFTNFIRGRSAIASLETLAEADHGGRLTEARRSQRALAREGMPWVKPLAAVLSACIARVGGDAHGAEHALREAIELAEAAEMPLHAVAARHQLGLLLGGEPGHAMVHQAEDAMRVARVRVPARYAQMLAPGSWTRSHE